jgi:homeobox-leucine zipper protein
VHRMFKECPHPDENQRAALSRELGLEPRQIKFWFQNRRTQMKVRTEFSLRSFAVFHFDLFSLVLTIRA